MLTSSVLRGAASVLRAAATIVPVLAPPAREHVDQIDLQQG